jgi:predicted phage terminase large subunit-like protein
MRLRDELASLNTSLKTLNSSQSGRRPDDHRLQRIWNDPAKFAEHLGYRNAHFHKEIYAMIKDQNSSRVLVILPPGHGKSTCATINNTLWQIGRNPNIRIIMASHTKDFVANYIRQITTWLQKPEYIQIFGELKPTPPNKWTQNEIIVKRNTTEKDPTVTAVGTGQAIIGRRADLIICDDIIDEDSASGENQRQKVRTWFKKELLTRLEPAGRLIVVGTRWHYADLYGELLNDGAYEKLLFPAINQNNEALWPKRWPLKKLVELRQELGSIVFSAQYMCNPTPLEGGLLKAEWLNYWDETAHDPANRIYRIPSIETLRIYQGWDLAISENPDADWTVCVTIGADSENNVYILDILRKHLNFPAQVNAVLSLAKNWNPYRIAIESNIYQAALAQSVSKETIPVVQVKQHQNKLWRLMDLAPHFENGRIRINRELHEDLISEYLQFPKGEHDDILDALHLAFTPVKEQPLVVMDLFPDHYMQGSRVEGLRSSNYPF